MGRGGIKYFNLLYCWEVTHPTLDRIHRQATQCIDGLPLPAPQAQAPRLRDWCTPPRHDKNRGRWGRCKGGSRSQVRSRSGPATAGYPADKALGGSRAGGEENVGVQALGGNGWEIDADALGQAQTPNYEGCRLPGLGRPDAGSASKRVAYREPRGSKRRPRRGGTCPRLLSSGPGSAARW